MIRRRPGRVRRALIRLLAGATVGALAGLAVAQAAPPRPPPPPARRSPSPGGASSRT
ncbi:hypothetical protein O1M54_21690 [Streptomyces diastatochromogenes]|nr:hypothetical protein [Streptomyces diastatochromogenes]